MATKVEIVISNGTYDPSVDKENKNFVGVDYWIPCPGNEGAGSPCDTPERIHDSIERAKERIRSFGFIPVIKDLRKKATLLGY